LSDVLSQRPPHVVSVEFVHAGRPPAGWPEVTRLQAPELLLQVWHWPVQVAGQQIPSGAQKPEVHCPPVVHVLPVPFPFFVVQLPVVESQYWLPEHEFDVQEPRQVPLPSVAHAPLGHVEAVLLGLAPLPSQYEARVC
jgi:hypothetical protein